MHIRRFSSDLISWLLDQYAELAAAVRFLSILPLPDPPQRIETESETTLPARVVLGSGYFSLVGLLLTGGLHLDGLMDSCDGLFGGRTPERRLEIMRDSRVGSFGVLGGVCALLLKFAFFASLEQHALLVALLVVLPSARWAMLLALSIFPPARRSGLGVTYQQTITLQRLALGASIALFVALVAAHLAGALVWGTATLTAIALGSWITRRIGGLTGDTCGAIAEITEVVMLLLLLFLRTWL